MPDAYTVLWNRERVQIAQRHNLLGKPLPFLFGGPHISQPLFSRAGVRPLDTVWPIYVCQGVLHLLAKVTVDRIVPIEQWVADRPGLFPPERKGRWTQETLDHFVEDHPEMRAVLWTCTSEALVASDSTPLRLDLRVPSDILLRLAYWSRKAERPLKGVVDGRLKTSVGLQGIYRLAPSAAESLLALTG